MKGFTRGNPLFSLCGLNCGLCPMHLGGYCGGCGNGNQSCAIARCSLEHGHPSYCFECAHFPCPRYEGFDDADSFIPHSRRRADVERAQRIGVDAYTLELQERMRMLDELLEGYNDGRRKSLFCAASYLLELPALRGVLEQLRADPMLLEATAAQRGARAAQLLQEAADGCGVRLKLNKKPRNESGSQN